MPVKRLKTFLDKQNVKYATIGHSLAYTAQEIAQTAHISGDRLAKVVIVSVDGRDVMVVLPATEKIGLDHLKSEMGASHVSLADESKFSDEFPGCELGAMPPFGNLYNMDVYVSDDWSDQDTIVFNAGTHSELVELAYNDFKKLVKPKKVTLHS